MQALARKGAGRTCEPSEHFSAATSRLGVSGYREKRTLCDKAAGTACVSRAAARGARREQQREEAHE